MSKETINTEIEAYKRRGGDFAFSFGDRRLPVTYNAIVGTLAAEFGTSKVMIVVNYYQDLDYNLDTLMNKLLSQHPELVE